MPVSRYETAALNQVHSRNMQPQTLPEHPTARACWQSRDFLAVLYRDPNGHDRLSVNRVAIDRYTGRWRDGITWDELQHVKDQCGFADRWAVEVYPPTGEVVDVAAIRHLWLLDAPPPYAWTETP